MTVALCLLDASYAALDICDEPKVEADQPTRARSRIEPCVRALEAVFLRGQKACVEARLEPFHGNDHAYRHARRRVFDQVGELEDFHGTPFCAERAARIAQERS